MPASPRCSYSSASRCREAEFNPLIGKTFYVFISVVNLLLISVFWSFLLELFEKGQTKRLFGIIAAGGSAGALAGPLISDLSVDSIGESGILFLGAALFVAAIVCQRALLAIWKDRSDAVAGEDRPIGGNVFAGVTLVLRSPYLLGIALFIVGISAASTLLYFEQLRLVEITFAEVADRTRVFARLDWIVQSLTVLSQIFLTGRIAARFGVTALLTIVPIVMVAGFLTLAASGTFALFAIVMVVRRSGEYAFVRPGPRDALEPARQGDEVQSQEHDRRAGISRCRRGHCASTKRNQRRRNDGCRCHDARRGGRRGVGGRRLVARQTFRGRRRGGQAPTRHRCAGVKGMNVVDACIGNLTKTDEQTESTVSTTRKSEAL